MFIICMMYPFQKDARNMVCRPSSSATDTHFDYRAAEGAHKEGPSNNYGIFE